MDDVGLMVAFDRLKRGDRAAFSDFAECAGAMLHRFLRGMRVDHHQAEEIVQDCMVTAWRRLDTLRDRARLAAWLRTVARNRFLSALRREEPPEVPLDDVFSVFHVDVLDDSFLRLLRVEVARLPPSRRRIVELRVLSGISPGEVEALTGIERGRQRRQLYKALTTLRARLEVREGHLEPRQEEVTC